MRGQVQARWLLVLCAVVLAVLAAPVDAQEESPTAVNIVVFGYVDVAGAPDGSNPVAPACNLQYDSEDQEFARTTPLQVMTFVVRDPNGNEVARGDTSALAELQRVRFNDVADHASYEVRMESPPSGWRLCPNQESTRTIELDDITLGQARLNYYFYVHTGPVPTDVPTEPPTIETPVTPGTPVTPETPVTPDKPTAETPKPPNGGDNGDDGGDNGDDGGDQPAAPAKPIAPSQPMAPVERDANGVAYVNPPAGTGELAMIKGMAFLDNDCDGGFGAGEPGLNAVQVYLHGGSTHISQITPGTGAFSFEALGDGEYDVFVNPGPEWTITTPWKYVVRVRGNIVTGIDFGLCRGEAADDVEDVAPGAGIRLPDTGVMEAPRGQLLGGMALALTLVGLVGLALERRRARSR